MPGQLHLKSGNRSRVLWLAEPIRIVEWFAGEQLAILAPKRSNRDRKRLHHLLMILNDHRGERTLRDLNKSHGFGREELERLAREYPEQIVLEKKEAGKGSKGGRPSALLRKNIPTES